MRQSERPVKTMTDREKVIKYLMGLHGSEETMAIVAKAIILLKEGDIEMKLREALDRLRDIGMSKKLLEEAVEEAGLENVVISHALAEDLIEKLDALRELWESRELK